jgi:hypothetical protein
MSGIIDTIAYGARIAYAFAWDLALTTVNIVSPKKPAGSVIPPGLPGHGGVWPPFEAPKSTDSRSPCPALNAMANHGTLSLCFH